jgi:WD40 repeat protein
MYVGCLSDGEYIDSDSADDTICVWNTRTGLLAVCPFEGHKDCVFSVDFSPDGKYVVSASSDRSKFGMQRQA